MVIILGCVLRVDSFVTVHRRFLFLLQIVVVKLKQLLLSLGFFRKGLRSNGLVDFKRSGRLKFRIVLLNIFVFSPAQQVDALRVGHYRYFFLRQRVAIRAERLLPFTPGHSRDRSIVFPT